MTMQPMEPTLATFQNPLARYFAATRPAFLTASSDGLFDRLVDSMARRSGV